MDDLTEYLHQRTLNRLAAARAAAANATGVARLHADAEVARLERSLAPAEQVNA